MTSGLMRESSGALSIPLFGNILFFCINRALVWHTFTLHFNGSGSLPPKQDVNKTPIRAWPFQKLVVSDYDGQNGDSVP